MARTVAGRRDLLLDVIREQAADVIGLQEALDFQIDEIVAAIPAFGVIGVGRDDGARKGEYAAILFRRDRFQVSDAGTFWLSDTPRSWRQSRGATTSRESAPGPGSSIGTAVRSGTTTSISITSRSRRGSAARKCCAREWTRAALPEEPVVITGDFNAGERNAAVAAITSSGTFVDTFRVKHPNERWSGRSRDSIRRRPKEEKIDYVFAPAGARCCGPTSCERRAPAGCRPIISRWSRRSACRRPSERAAERYSARSAAMTLMRSAWRAGMTQATIAVTASSAATTA